MPSFIPITEGLVEAMKDKSMYALLKIGENSYEALGRVTDFYLADIWHFTVTSYMSGEKRTFSQIGPSSSLYVLDYGQFEEGADG